MDGGQLNAFGGRVELGGLAQPGTVALGVDGDNLSLKFPENVVRTSVSLTNQAAIYVEGTGGGDIAVNARNLEILGGRILSGGIGTGLGTPKTVAGDITLNATGEIKVAGESIVGNFVPFGSLGNGGNITINSGSFSLQDGAQLLASTDGRGNAGNVNVNVTGAVDIAGKKNGLASAIYSTVETEALGDGGDITINSGSFSLQDGALLLASTYGLGNAGNINVNVTGAVDIAGKKNGLASAIYSTVETEALGDGGDITIVSGSFSLQDGAQLLASTYGRGNAGNVRVLAQDAVSLADAFIFSTVSAGGQGNSSNIHINAATLSLIDGAQVATSALGVGNAGNIILDADVIALDGAKSGVFNTLVQHGVNKQTIK